jgi:hypothetical protein
MVHLDQGGGAGGYTAVFENAESAGRSAINFTP